MSTSPRLNAGGRYVTQPDGSRKLEPVDVPTPEGSAGQSAYQLWLSLGNVGSMAAYMASLKGDAGSRGWTPVLRGTVDGVRTLVEVYDWTGGAGTKPDVGYLTETGGLASAKASGFNFNRSKRIESYTATTRTTALGQIGIGEQSITFLTPFPAAPRVIATARANLGGRPVVPEVVSVTATDCKVRASQSKATLASLLTALFDLTGGITIDVLVIEN